MTRPLSPQQREILRLVADGRTNLEIGQVMFLSMDTVKTVVGRMCRARNLPNRAALVHWGWLHGAVGDRGELVAEVTRLRAALVSERVS